MRRSGSVTRSRPSAWITPSARRPLSGNNRKIERAVIDLPQPDSPTSAKVSLIPQNTVKLEGKPAQQMMKLMEALDDHDDVQNISSNFDISEKEIEASLA